MRRPIGMVAAALLAVGGLSFWAMSADQPSGGAGGAGAGQMTGGAAGGAQTGGQLPQGVTRSDKPDAQGIRDELSGVTLAAFRENGWNSLVGHLARNDRDRLAKFDTQGKLDSLNGKVREFEQAWKNKYQKEFAGNLRESDVFGQQLTIVQGEVTNPALMSNWPVAPTRGTDMRNGAGMRGGMDMRGGAGGAGGGAEVRGEIRTGEPGAAGGATGGATGGAATGIDKGSNVAVVTFPADQTHGRTSELNISLLREPPTAWRVDIPDTIDGQKLHDNLLAHVNELLAMKDRWPQDANEAYRTVSYHVFQALYGLPAKTTTPAGGAGGAGAR